MLLVLCGESGSGKSTIANYLRAKHKFIELTLAEPVKQIASILSGINLSILNGLTEENRVLRENVKDKIYGKTGREWLIFVGTKIFREKVDEDIWIKLLLQRVSTLRGIQPGCNIIVSDCRFKNELKLLKKNGAIVMSVIRNNNTSISNNNYGYSNFVDDFAKDNSDYIVKNSGDIKELHAKIDHLLGTIKE